jgi:hypothetical protein
MRYLFASSLFLAITACLASGLAAQSAGLVAHWTFDDPTKPLIDVVGGHQGTFKDGAIVSKTNMPALAGNVGALALPKNGAYVQVPHHADFNFAPKQSMSYALWLRMTISKASYHVWGKRQDCAEANYQSSGGHANGVRGLAFGSHAGSQGSSVAGLGPPIDQWVHFAVSFDGADLSLYLDGVMTGQSTFTFYNNSNTSDLLIGTSGTCAAALTFVGLIDDFRLYNRALSQREIAILAMRVPATKVGTGCIATGTPPILFVDPPVHGKDCRLMANSLLPNTAGVILLGIQHKGIPLSPKCTAYFDITLPTVPIFFSTNAGGGWLSPPIAVSTSLSLNGVEIALQAALANLPTAPFGMALSNGVWVTIGY